MQQLDIHYQTCTLHNAIFSFDWTRVPTFPRRESRGKRVWSIGRWKRPLPNDRLARFPRAIDDGFARRAAGCKTDRGAAAARSASSESNILDTWCGITLHAPRKNAPTCTCVRVTPLHRRSRRATRPAVTRSEDFSEFSYLWKASFKTHRWQRERTWIDVFHFTSRLRTRQFMQFHIFANVTKKKWKLDGNVSCLLNIVINFLPICYISLYVRHTLWTFVSWDFPKMHERCNERSESLE